ncbi:MAG: hypothetical protein JOY59_03520, partial [Candidatus Eremiobacteraeota bacterium]|nr:hypothetical protein [Candidatus Eremiobacteraeota bacterium]
LTGGIGSTGSASASVPATLQATTAHGYLYVDNALSLDSGTIAAIANDFENAYAVDTAHFGIVDYPANAPHGPQNASAGDIPCDANGNQIAGASPIPVVIPEGDPHVVVLLVAQKDAGNGEGGYFDPTNYFVQSYANCFHAVSNQSAMFVAVWPTNADVAYETQEDMVRVMAHEFEHVVNFVNRYVLNPQPPSSDPSNPSIVGDLAYTDEGFAMLAQDFAIAQLYPSLPYDVDEGLFFAGDFLASPQTVDIHAFEGTNSGTGAPSLACNGCFGGAYLLQRYLYNRFGGDAYTRAMTTASGSTDSNLAKITSEPWGSVLSDFSVALMAAQNGLSPSTAFSFAIAPSATFTDQFGSPYSLPGIGLAGTSALGSTTTYTSCLGCLMYVGVPTNGAAATLTVTDLSGGANLSAGIVQK